MIYLQLFIIMLCASGYWEHPTTFGYIAAVFVFGATALRLLDFDNEVSKREASDLIKNSKL